MTAAADEAVAQTEQAAAIVEVAAAGATAALLPTSIWSGPLLAPWAPCPPLTQAGRVLNDSNAHWCAIRFLPNHFSPVLPPAPSPPAVDTHHRPPHYSRKEYFLFYCST